MSAPLLEVRHLVTRFHTRAGVLPVVDGVSFMLQRGRVLGLVGESGSGKSVTGFSIMGLVDAPGRVEGGEVLFDGQDVLAMTEPQRRDLRGRRMAMIFQDPMATLNPVLRVDTQMIEAVRAHAPVSQAEAREQAVRTLALMGIPSPEQRLLAYPHQLSGGMRQRVALLRTLLLRRPLLLLDEPFAALDALTRRELQSWLLDTWRLGSDAAVLVTHDVREAVLLSDRVYVMSPRPGRIISDITIDRGPDGVLDAVRLARSEEAIMQALQLQHVAL